MKGNMIILLVIGIWIGLLIGLSFIEAPLKFTAPGITTELGVGIGRIMFSVLNKIEILFALFLIASIAVNKSYLSMDGIHIASLVLIIGLVLMQSFWLLPALDTKALALIDGQRDTDHYYHILYVIAEVSKLITLFILFFKFSKS